MKATANGTLGNVQLRVSPQTAATVMLVSGGYPGEYLKDRTITGFENVRDSLVFHAGTVKDNDLVKSSGGRVIAITSIQDTLFESLQQAVADAGRIYYDGRYFRNDIGFDLMELL